jgi:hypothetical protein
MRSVDQYCPLGIWLDSEEDRGIDVSVLRILAEYGFTISDDFNYSYEQQYGYGHGYGRDNGYGSNYGYGHDIGLGNGIIYGYVIGLGTCGCEG